MDQSYYFPNPTPGPPVPGNSNEGPRPTVVHRLPQTGSLKAPSTGREAKRLLTHLLLLGFTILTTTGVGILWFYDRESPVPYFHAIGAGIVYSFTILTILAAHEMGHYIACCWYGVDATLPYFIPVPIPPVG